MTMCSPVAPPHPIPRFLKNKAIATERNPFFISEISPALRINPIIPQTVTGNTMSVSTRNSVTADVAQFEIQMRHHNTAQQHLMPPPLKPSLPITFIYESYDHRPTYPTAVTTTATNSTHAAWCNSRRRHHWCTPCVMVWGWRHTVVYGRYNN